MLSEESPSSWCCRPQWPSTPKQGAGRGEGLEKGERKVKGMGNEINEVSQDKRLKLTSCDVLLNYPQEPETPETVKATVEWWEFSFPKLVFCSSENRLSAPKAIFSSFLNMGELQIWKIYKILLRRSRSGLMRVFSYINIGVRKVSSKAWNKWDDLFIWKSLKYESGQQGKLNRKAFGKFLSAECLA